jgi:plastocyanin
MRTRVSLRALLVLLSLLGVGGHALALDDPNRVTLPTAASIVGAAPFFSDVRVFNTSYDATISLEATYRCFIGSCPAQDRGLQIVVGPRETKAFNDMVGVAFSAPNSAGGIEFEVTAGGSAVDVGITSRLYSTAPTPTVGMFIPGVLTSAAQPVTFLGQIANGGSGLGFRTNAGAFNGGNVAWSARFDVFDANGQLLGTVTREIAAHSGTQINNIFGAINRGSESINDAVIVVTSNGALFSYAAVIDNQTTDPFLVIGAEDVPAPPGHIPPPALTQTPTPQATPRPPSPTPTPAPQGQTVIVNVGEGGLNFVDQASGSNMTRIHVGDTVRWVWVGGSHSTTSGGCSGGCRADGLWDSGTGSGKVFERKFTQAGTFPYHCIPHGAAMTGVIQVQ